MRGSFNRTVDVVKGPGSAFPGLFVGTFDCRFVEEDGIFTVGTGAPIIPAYMTLDSYKPIGAWTAPFFGMHADRADQVAIPSGGPLNYWVLYTDVVIWFELTPYWRAYLVQLPLPSEDTSGGLIGSGQATIVVHHNLVGDGGLFGNSTAAIRLEKHLLAQGGALLDGKADWHKKDFLFGIGGALADSAAYVSFKSFHEGSGGLMGNYNAVLRYYRSFLAQGGALGNSQAAWSYAGSGFGPHGAVASTDDVGPPNHIRIHTSPNHGLSGGETVTIAGCTNCTGANGTWTITYDNLSTFLLNGSAWTPPGGAESAATWTSP